MSKLRCKVGDLAIITRARNTQLLGRLVLVEHRPDPADFDWVVRLLGAPIFGTTYYNKRFGVFQEILTNDRNLTPIRGEEPEVVETERFEEVR